MGRHIGKSEKRISGDNHAHRCKLCVAVKSGFCKHFLAMMPKVCNFTLHNYKNVTELQHEAFEICSATCTSTLQRWHQPRIEGTTPCPILWKGPFPKQLEGEQKSSDITCHLCEVRKIDRKSKLNDFVEGTIIIEAHCK